MLGNVEDKLHKLGDPGGVRRCATTCRTTATDFWDIIISEVKKPEHKHLEGLTLAAAGTKLGKHYVDAMLDSGGLRAAAHRVLRPGPQHAARPANRSRQLSVRDPRPFRRRRAHQVPDRRESIPPSTSSSTCAKTTR